MVSEIIEIIESLPMPSRLTAKSAPTQHQLPPNVASVPGSEEMSRKKIWQLLIQKGGGFHRKINHKSIFEKNTSTNCWCSLEQWHIPGTLINHQPLSTIVNHGPLKIPASLSDLNSVPFQSSDLGKANGKGQNQKLGISKSSPKDKANPDATAESALEMDSRIRSTSVSKTHTKLKHLKPKRCSIGRNAARLLNPNLFGDLAPICRALRSMSKFFPHGPLLVTGFQRLEPTDSVIHRDVTQ